MQRPFHHHRRVALDFTMAKHILDDEPGILLGMARDVAMELAASDEHFPHVMTAVRTPVVEHEIEVVLGRSKPIGTRAVMVPVIFSHVDGAKWFPEVDGELEIINENDRTHNWCDVSFFGTYRPRLGVLGAAIDAAALHVRVEETLEQFLNTACAHLLDTARAESMSS